MPSMSSDSQLRLIPGMSFKGPQSVYWVYRDSDLDAQSTLEIGDLDFKKLEYGCRMICAGVPSFFGLGLEDGHVPTFWHAVGEVSGVRSASASQEPAFGPKYNASPESPVWLN